MATAAEIERLTVKLIADASQYDAGLRKAEADTTAAVRRIEAAASDAIEDHTAAMREAAAIAQAVATPTEKYAQEVAKLNQLHLAGYLDFDAYVRAMDQAKLKLPETQQAIARYREEQERAAKATHEATMAVKAAAMARMREAEAAEAAAKAQGKAVYDATRTSAERYAIKLKEVEKLHKSGHISTDTYTRSVKQLGREFSVTGQRMQAVANGARSVQSGLLTMGTSLSLGVTAPLTIFAGTSTAAFATFNNEMTKSMSIMDNLTSEQMTELDAKAKQLGSTTTSSATEIAQGFGLLASAGLSVEASLNSVGQVAQFATAAEMDMAKATDYLMSAQTSLGLRSEDATENMLGMARVSDVLTKAAGISNAGIEDLATSLTNKAGPALKGVNKTIEEGVAVLAVYHDRGIKSERASEQLAIALRELDGASRENAEAWKNLGVEVYNADGSMRHFADIIGDMEKALGPLSVEQQRAKMELMGFRMESVSAIQPLLGTSDAIRKYNEQLKEATGYTKVVSDFMGSSFAKQLEVVANKLNVIAIEVGEKLAPVLLLLSQYLDKGMNLWNSMSDEMQTAAIVIAAIAAAVGPFMLTMGLLLGVVLSLASAIAALGVTGTAIIGGIGVWAAQVVIFMGALMSLVAWIVGPEGLSNAWTKASKTAYDFFTKAVGFIANLQTNVGILVSWFRENWTTLMFDAIEMLKVFVVNGVSNVMTMVKTLGRLWVVWRGYMAGVFMNLFTVDFVNAVIEGIKVVGKLLFQFATFQADILARILTGTASEADFAGFFSQISKDFKKGMETQDLAGSMRDVIREGMGELKGPLDGFVSQAGGPNFVYDFAKTNIGEPAGQGIADGITEGTEKAGEGVKAELTELGKKIQDYTQSLHEQIATQGMSSRELEVWKLRMEGATDAELRGVIAMSRHLDAIEKQNAAIEAGRSIMEEFKTPQEKYRDRMAELTKHLQGGTIDLISFGRAAAAAKATLAGGIDVDFRVSGVEAVASGSAEALARFDAFKATSGLPAQVKIRQNYAMRQAELRGMGRPAAGGPMLAGPVGPGDAPRPSGSAPGAMTPYETQSLILLDQIAMGLGRGRKTGQRVVMPANLQGEQT
jgi:TP901 family phage tail tape measure protein